MRGGRWCRGVGSCTGVRWPLLNKVEQLRRQIAELTEQLNAEEHRLSRLASMRETMSEICAG